MWGLVNMRNWPRWLAFAALGGLALIAVRQGWLDFLSDEKQVAGFIQARGLPGLLAVMGAGTVYTALGGPRQLLAFVLGFALSPVYGTVISTAVTVLGATLCFFVARVLLQRSLADRFGPRMERFDRLFQQRTMTKILVVRLLPVGSNLATNVIAGCSHIRFLPFLMGSGLGYLPQMLVFALAGAGIGNADHYQFALSVLLFIVASLLGGYLLQQHRNRLLTTPLSEDS